ncbi:Guanine deaminase [Hypsizygus marmoreus]|uniref:Guanine deaminase n=1 Tax=Hypsizygus marmoreus TaxID=39966 RepID=A0A369JS31_HYPMA|nr:Guanine deaminase [Hypsizygus marmoreus]
MPRTQTIYYGAVINPQSLTAYQALPHCLLAVGPIGTIDWIVDDVQEYELQDALAAKGCIDVDVVALRAGEFLMPGFVDTHTHAPQSPNIGSGQQYELLDWLNHVTFPMEAKFADVEFARHTYESVVRRSLDSGTTTCCYYGTLHLEATKILADIVHARGQRAFIGKCNMDRNCPDHYIEPSAESSIADTLSLISHIRTLSGTAAPSSPPTSPTSPPPLVHPILTPRFAISCTPKLLSSLGALASSDPTLHIQTHISENLSEIAFTHTLFPSLPHYAAVYESFGLLRNNTVLAHAVHLSPPEIELIAKAGAGISHCPTSNFNLSSGVAPVGVYLDAGLKVGLGTDVSGGFSPSILVAVQHASIASKVYAVQHAQRKRDKEAKAKEVDDDGIEIPAITPIPTPAPAPPPTCTPPTFTNRQLPVPTLLHLATLGGASVCALDHAIGSFAVGKSFDALLVNTRNDAGNPALWSPDHDPALGRERLEGLVERFLFCGDDRNVERVWVAGVCVGGTAWRG